MDYQKLLFGLGLTFVASLARKKYKEDFDDYENFSHTGNNNIVDFRNEEIGRLVIMILLMLAGIWIMYNAIAEYFNRKLLPIIW